MYQTKMNSYSIIQKGIQIVLDEKGLRKCQTKGINYMCVYTWHDIVCNCIGKCISILNKYWMVYVMYTISYVNAYWMNDHLTFVILYTSTKTMSLMVETKNSS